MKHAAKHSFSLLKTKQNKIILAIVALGAVILLMFPIYYALPNVGVPECSTGSTGQFLDPSNCGDADFGGVYFLLVGVPILVFGVTAFCVSLILDRTVPKRKPKPFRTGHLFKIFLITAVILVVALYLVVFLTE